MAKMPEYAPGGMTVEPVDHVQEHWTILFADGTVHTPEVPPEADPTRVLGLGRYMGGTKHGIRQELPDFQHTSATWRATIYQHHYTDGTVLVQKMEVHRG